MMKKSTGFIRRLFESRGFRRGTRILFWVTTAYLIYNIIRLLIAIMRIGVSFREALRIILSISPSDFDPMWPFYVLIFLSIALGLICYFQGKEKSRNATEDTAEEKPAELSNPVQEEELPEPKYHQYH